MNFALPSIGTDFYRAALPIFVLSTGSVLAMLQAVFKRGGSRTAVLSLLLVSLAAALASAVPQACGQETAFLGGSYLTGSLAGFGQVMILSIALVVSLLFHATYLRKKFYRAEISSLYQAVVCGMLVMVASNDLVTMFVGLELSSIGLYALVGYLNPSRTSQEGAIKYFILGSFAAAILLFGIGLLYGATGTLSLADLVDQLPKLGDHYWVRLGALLTLVGIGFKLALVPFHLWAPDTYEAAPTGITAMMATAVKVMILVVALRLFAGSLSTVYETWLPAMMFLATLSVVIGNLMALVQSSLRRMLAYSSVAHSGYMAIAICALGGASADFPVAAILFYIVSYTVISIGTFAILMWLENEQQDNLILDDLAGLAKRHPWAAAALTVFMFSFAGMPPTVGFMGKFFVFNAALANQLYNLVIIGVIGSSISLFYYLRVIVKMYMTEATPGATPKATPRSILVTAIVALLVLANLTLGTLLPDRLMTAMSSTSQAVAGRHQVPTTTKALVH